MAGSEDLLGVRPAAIQGTVVFAFGDPTEYSHNCQQTAEKAGEIEQGCEQILRTFKVD